MFILWLRRLICATVEREMNRDKKPVRPTKQDGPTLSPQERELATFLAGVKVEFEEVAEVEQMPGSATFDMFEEMVDSAIRMWASYWDIEIIEDAELCEPDSNIYASGMGFRHSTHFTCFAVLEDGRHIHVGWRSGYVYGKTYYHIEEVKFERMAEVEE